MSKKDKKSEEKTNEERNTELQELWGMFGIKNHLARIASILKIPDEDYAEVLIHTLDKVLKKKIKQTKERDIENKARRDDEEINFDNMRAFFIRNIKELNEDLNSQK